MGSVNKVIILGRLGADPELKYTQDQTPVSNFSVATSEVIRVKVEKKLIKPLGIDVLHGGRQQK